MWHTQFPIYAFVICLLIAFVYTIPIGMIQAITNQQIGLNVITELIVGYWLPGKPLVSFRDAFRLRMINFLTTLCSS